MTIDHGRLIRPGKKSGQLFGVRQVYFAKSCQQIWMRVNHPFIPWTENSISEYKLHSFNIHKLLKKFPKSPIRPSGSHFCSASCGECLNEH